MNGRDTTEINKENSVAANDIYNFDNEGYSDMEIEVEGECESIEMESAESDSNAVHLVDCEGDQIKSLNIICVMCFGNNC